MAAMRRTIQAAIAKGVPAFNAGDHMGCAMIYRAAATELLRGGGLPSETDTVLRTAVQESQRGDATSSAWTLREALDWCMAAGSGAAAGPPPSSRRSSSSSSGSGSSSGNSEAAAVARIISQAIELGVPLYNSGEHGACADVYADAAQRLAQLQLPARTRQQLMEAAKQSAGRPTDRAWALRRALDGCLEV
eukprot:COSAG06_NODE_15409_length_1072_cov_4.094553_2_plen_190_part_01